MALPLSYLSRLYMNSLTKEECSCMDCLYPSKILTTSADDGKEHWMYIPCGRCVRCADRQRNEWCTRMCLHSLDYKYCYYVTLTYGSYNLNEFYRHPFKQAWLETAPTLDSNNYYHRPAWTPSLLVKKHLQDFFKRLRRDLNSPITYCAAGEYGSDSNGEGYGRPHFHLIVWSDELLSRETFKRAWSFDCVYLDAKNVVSYNGKQNTLSRCSFLIGNVEFENLTLSGALDWDGVSRHKNTSRDCFSYVAKYVGKRSAIPRAAWKRIERVWQMLPISPLSPDLDRETPTFDDLVGNITVYKHIQFNGHYYDKITKDEWRKICAPFFTCSRGKGIGKSYGLQNLSRFSRGSYSLPKFQGRSLPFPAYYARLASNAQYPVRVRAHSALSDSLSKCNLPRLRTYFETLRADGTFCFSAEGRTMYEQLLKPLAKYSGKVYDVGSGALCDITLCYPDGNVHYAFSSYLDSFEGYAWNKHKKSFDFVDCVPRIDFCELMLDFIAERLKDYNVRLRNKQKSLELYESVFTDETYETRVDYANRRAELSRMYKRNHRKRCDAQ